MADLIKKQLNTRIALKYDTLENWSTNNPKLLPGEVALVAIQNHFSTGDALDPAQGAPPSVAMKVGDGTRYFNDLPYTQAIAGDVYAWAKAAERPTYNYTDIVGLVDYVAGTADAEGVTGLVGAYELTVQKDLGAETPVHKLVLTSYNDKHEAVRTYEVDLSNIEKNLDDLDAATAKLREDLDHLIDTTLPDEIAGAIDDLKNELVVAEEAEGYVAADGQIVNYIWQDKGLVKVNYRALTTADFADDLINQSAVKGLVTELANIRNDFAAADTALEGSLKNYIETEHAKMELKAEDLPEGDFVTAVTQAHGKISVTRANVTVDNVVGLNEALTELDDKKENKLVFTDRPTYLADEGQDAEGFVANPVTTKKYVDEKFSNVSSALLFKGVVDTDPRGDAEAGVAPLKGVNGDVVIWDTKTADGTFEFVYSNGEWVELGAEGVHASKAELKALSDCHDSEMQALETKHDEDITKVREDFAAADEEVLGNVNDLIQALDADTADMKTPAEGEPITEKFITRIVQKDGKIESAEFGTPEIADVTGLSTKLGEIDAAIEDLDDTKEDKLAFTYEPSRVDADPQGEGYDPVATKKYVDENIDALNYSVSADDENAVVSGDTQATEYNVLTGFEIENGALKENSVTAQKLAPIAVTGHAKDLDVEDTVFVLYCGTASTLVDDITLDV